MPEINIAVEGDKILINNLGSFIRAMPEAIDRGLSRVAMGIEREAEVWLHGAGGTSKKVRTDYTGFTKKSGEAVAFRSYAGAGAYPVPVRTKHLLSLLDWLKPGESKTGDIGTFSAGPHEVVVYDSAKYADVIFQGRGSSAKFGPRNALVDGLTHFNQGAQIVTVMNQEIQNEIKAQGLK